MELSWLHILNCHEIRYVPLYLLIKLAAKILDIGKCQLLANWAGISTHVHTI